jgi:hypothetical protein
MNAIQMTMAIVLLAVVLAIAIRLLGEAGRAEKENRLEGRIFGVKISVVGKAAVVFAAVLIVLLVYKQVVGDDVSVTFVIAPTSDTDDCSKNMLREKANNFALVLGNGSAKIKVSGFDYSQNKGELVKTQTVSKQFIQQVFQVSTEPALSDSQLTPDRLTLTSDVALRLDCHDREPIDWNMALNVKSEVFGPGARASRMKNLMIVEPKGATAALDFTAYAGYGEIQSKTLWARVCHRSEVESILSDFSRDKIQQIEADALCNELDDATARCSRLGEELGFTRSGKAEKGHALRPRGNVVMDDMTPRVGPFPNDTSQGRIVIVFVELVSMLPSSAQTGAEEHFGELFSRPTDRAILVVREMGPHLISVDSVRTEFKKKAARVVSTLGNFKFRRSPRSLVLDMQGLDGADVARMRWVWE